MSAGRVRTLFHLRRLVPLSFALVVFLLPPSSSPRGYGLREWDRTQAWDGYTVVETLFDCLLINMKGEEVRRFPASVCLFSEKGEIVTAVNVWGQNRDSGLAQLPDRGYLRKIHAGEDSIRETPYWIHHDIQESPVDEALWLTATPFDGISRDMFFQQPLNEEIAAVSRTGETLFRWSVLDHVGELPPEHGGNRRAPFPFENGEAFWNEALTDDDVPYLHATSFPEREKPVFNPLYGLPSFTHINSVQVFPENPLSEMDPAFRPGNILVSDALRSRIFVIDRQSRKIVWSHLTKGAQHTARLLPSGSILYFQNGTNSGRSEAVEIEPISHKVLWRYSEAPLGTMYCDHLGSAQRLPNGNTLISYACGSSVALEVSPGKEVVWKWVLPDSIVDNAGLGGIYRATRISKELGDAWIRSEASGRDTLPSRKLPVPESLAVSLATSGLDLFKKVDGKDGPYDTLTLEFSGEGSRLELRQVKGISHWDAWRRSEEKMSMLKGIYAPQVSPYPDRLSNTIACAEPPEVKMERLSGGWAKAAYLSANERFTYGGCLKKEQTYRSLLAFAYCRSSKALVEMRYFLKAQGQDAMARAGLLKMMAFLQCK